MKCILNMFMNSLLWTWKKNLNLCILIIPNKHKFLTHDNDDSKITWCVLRISMLSWLTLASQCIQMATTYNFQLGKTFHYTLCCLILNILVFTITITIMYLQVLQEKWNSTLLYITMDIYHLLFDIQYAFILYCQMFSIPLSNIEGQRNDTFYSNRVLLEGKRFLALNLDYMIQNGGNDVLKRKMGQVWF